jgi:signal peptidase I
MKTGDNESVLRPADSKGPAMTGNTCPLIKPEAGNVSSMVTNAISLAKTLAVILVAAVFIRGTILEAFKIPSGSMIPTLRPGDHIFVWKFAYGLRLPLLQKTVWEFGIPNRGDIVVFTRQDDPITSGENESGLNIIKRVIGLPGEKVLVRGTSVSINDQILVEPYARWEEGGSPTGNFGPEIVPANHIFLMGDNRDKSKDSRFWSDSHYLPIENVKGKALVIYWSFDNLGRIGTIIR